MRYFALACDYDGTIAHHGDVDEKTLEALEQVRASGRKLLLVTGRRLEELTEVFDRLDMFDWVVADNGGVLYNPATRDETIIAPTVPDDFVKALKQANVDPLDVGKSIVATRQPNETKVLKVIREMGLEMQVIFNKGAVMVVPSGTNKATGLKAALQRLELSPHNVAGIGDAENDHAFLSECELSVAVANALPQLKERADFVTAGVAGEGVQELIKRLLKDDLASLEKTVARHQLRMGTSRGRDVTIAASGPNMLFVGSSGGGKSTLVKVFLEQLVDSGYQFCVIDPEGDYEGFEEGVMLGDRSRVPNPSEVIQLLGRSEESAIVNLLGVPLDKRPAFFAELLSELVKMRARSGRPHWIIVDEAHHVLPREHRAGPLTLPQEMQGVVFVTVEPATVLPQALQMVETVFAVGENPQGSIEAYAKAVGDDKPAAPKGKAPERDTLTWARKTKAVRRFKMSPTRFEHRRHRRKYAEGDLGPVESFYFTGPGGKLNLMVQNLILFSQVAEGIDDETWKYHFERGDYVRWFNDVIKDPELAEEAKKVQRRKRISAKRSRELIRELIAERYTLPAETGLASDK